MNCPNCGGKVSEGMRFCFSCGANIENLWKIKPVCPKCKTECPEGARFCFNCGSKLEASLPIDNNAKDNSFGFDAVFSGFNIDELSDKADALGAAATKKNEKEAKESKLSVFEYAEQGDGTYVVTGLKNKMLLNVTVPDCVISIADGAFEGAGVFSVTLPEGLMQIGSRAFKNCKNLSVINIPETLVLLGDEAFCGCEILDISLPEGLRRVGRDALAGTAAQKREELESWTVGSEHTFGSYPQSSASSKEPIEWVVLKREENRALVISKNVLDSKEYDKDSNTVEPITSWEECSLRKWLNDEFYNTAFSAAEKEKIALTSLKSYYYKYREEDCFCAETNDKIFLLGLENWAELLVGIYDRKDELAKKILDDCILKIAPTKYALSNGFRLEDGADGYNSAYYEDGMRDEEAPMFNCYWLRGCMNEPPYDPRYDTQFVMVAYDDDITPNFSFWHGIGVRPCLWINL